MVQHNGKTWIVDSVRLGSSGRSILLTRQTLSTYHLEGARLGAGATEIVPPLPHQWGISSQSKVVRAEEMPTGICGPSE